MLKMRHNLNVMHIKKNVSDTLMGIVLDIVEKSKDTVKAHLHLEMNGHKSTFMDEGTRSLNEKGSSISR